MLTLLLSEPAWVAYSSLGTEDRRLVDSWFEHLRNWKTDEFVRSRSRRLKPDEELYAFQTSSDDLVIAFRVAADVNEVTVLSIFRGEWVRPYRAEAERSTV